MKHSTVLFVIDFLEEQFLIIPSVCVFCDFKILHMNMLETALGGLEGERCGVRVSALCFEHLF